MDGRVGDGRSKDLLGVQRIGHELDDGVGAGVACADADSVVAGELHVYERAIACEQRPVPAGTEPLVTDRSPLNG